MCIFTLSLFLHLSLFSLLSLLACLARHTCLSLLTYLSYLFLSSLTHLSLSLSFFLRSVSLFISPTDDDNVHSSTQLPVQKTLTLRARVRGLGPSLVGELLASCRNKLSRCTCCVVCCIMLCGVLCGVVCCVVVCGYSNKSHYTCRLSALVWISHHIDNHSTVQKSHCVNSIWDRQKNEKTKKNETSSSTCGQQCIMKCQEHNRS